MKISKVLLSEVQLLNSMMLNFFLCLTLIVQFSDIATEFSEIGCQVIGATVNTLFTHSEYVKYD